MLQTGRGRTRFQISVSRFFFLLRFGNAECVLAGSPEVQEWLTELDGFYIPDFSPTTDGSCADDPTAAAQAAERGWWTCGGHTRPTGKLFLFLAQVHDVNVPFWLDITACP